MIHRPAELDLRNTAPADRYARVVAAFAELAPGAAVVLILDHDPHALLYQLQIDRPGDFNWSPLEEGPQISRVRLDRRTAPHRHERLVHEYLGWDHDRLDATLEEAQAYAHANNWSDAHQRFLEFRHGLLRHIAIEESLLFPSFEKCSGMPPNDGPTAVMRSEHQEIQTILGDLSKVIEHAAHGPSHDARRRFDELVGALLGVLVEHNTKEEQVIYPSVDHWLGAGPSDALVRRMMAVTS